MSSQRSAKGHRRARTQSSPETWSAPGIQSYYRALSTPAFGALDAYRPTPIANACSTASPPASPTRTPEFARNAEARKRFAREAKIDALIEIAFVVSVIDAGIGEASSSPYLVEFLGREELANT